MMRMVNRDRHDIVMEILDKARNGKNKTEIIRDVGLSYKQTKQYLGTLLEKGLLEIDRNRRFRTTKTGQEFLDKCSGCFLCHWHQSKETKLPRK
jgi:predicted transcriptional regulator